MKKISVYVLILGVLVGIISGAIFASESATVTQSGTAASLSDTTDAHSSLGLNEAGEPNGPGGGPGGGGYGDGGSGGHGGHGGPGGFGDFEDPFLLIIAMVAVLVLLGL